MCVSPQVLEWLSKNVKDGGMTRYASEQEWRAAANHRRNAAKPLTPFVQDLLHDLQAHHVIGLSHSPCVVLLLPLCSC
jgi:hypothetical protein